MGGDASAFAGALRRCSGARGHGGAPFATMAPGIRPLSPSPSHVFCCLWLAGGSPIVATAMHRRMAGSRSSGRPHTGTCVSVTQAHDGMCDGLVLRLGSALRFPPLTDGDGVVLVPVRPARGSDSAASGIHSTQLVFPRATLPWDCWNGSTPCYYYVAIVAMA